MKPRPITAQKRQRAERRRNCARAIDLTWSSLRSHLSCAVIAREHGGNEEWEARCVREYAEVMYALSVELHELSKVDFKCVFFPLNVSI